jgi:hypothetical protein
MGYELEIVLRKLEGPFVCILDEKKEMFESVEAFIRSGFEKNVRFHLSVSQMERLCLNLRSYLLQMI